MPAWFDFLILSMTICFCYDESSFLATWVPANMCCMEGCKKTIVAFFPQSTATMALNADEQGGWLHCRSKAYMRNALQYPHSSLPAFCATVWQRSLLHLQKSRVYSYSPLQQAVAMMAKFSVR
eukprot:1560683-Amphidinium_carterae.1